MLNELRQALVGLRQSGPDLRTDLAAGLANAAETARVRASGLIYEVRSANPRVQRVADVLGRVAADFEQGKDGRPRIEPADTVRCLRYVERQARAAADSGMSVESFLDLLCQSVSRGRD